MSQAIILTVTDYPDLTILDGCTFQVRVLPGGRIQLRLIELIAPVINYRCPVIISGEQCGGRAGHDGKHYWANGD